MHRFLVVDDEPAVCEVVQMALESDGTCRVTSASTSDDALAAIVRDRPDAAIIDAVLPRVSGLELARQVVDIGLPVLVMSGEPAHQQRLVETGCHFLPKPFSIKQLIAETRQLLDDAWRRKAELSVALAHLGKNRAAPAMAHEQARPAARRRRGRHDIVALSARCTDCDRVWPRYWAWR